MKLNTSALIGSVLTGIIAGLSYFATNYIPYISDTTQQLIVGGFITAAITLLTQIRAQETAPPVTKCEQQSLPANKKAYISLGIRIGR